MEIIDSTKALGSLSKGWALTIGNFDGMHLGHQQIIASTRRAAQRLKTPGLAVMTFEPHPLSILHPERFGGILTPLFMKSYLLESAGVDCLIVLKDSISLLNLSPKDFVDKFLMHTVKPAVVVEGADFHFGYGRSGNIQILKDLGRTRGFDVINVPAKQLCLSASHGKNQVVCSSSLVRSLLETSRVADAGRVLGRPYRLMGRTISGRGIGRRIGFPTANIDPLKQVIPAEGVYAGYVAVADTLEQLCRQNRLRQAVFSIGRAKTFVGEHPLLVEAHILESNVEDLSGRCLAMDFVEQLRSQQRFEDRGKLAEQIAADCKGARIILDRHDKQMGV